jgi:hypothetical protein
LGARAVCGGVVKLRTVLNRPRLWRVTAALSALLLCGLVVVCAQGSLSIIQSEPTAQGHRAAPLPGWEYWCTKGIPRKERRRLAFCARVEGRVLSSTRGPNPNEAHIAVISDFHVVVVRLPDWEAPPSRGTNVVAIGPLVRARDGQREVQAFRYSRS